MRTMRIVGARALPGLLRAALLVVTVRPAWSEPDCRDDDSSCSSWAQSGECTRNPGFMLASCRLSCSVCRLTSPAPPARDAWETEDLTVAYPDSAVLEVGGGGALAALAQSEQRAVFTWFYAPWCKQCKIARPGFEGHFRAVFTKRLKLLANDLRLFLVPVRWVLAILRDFEVEGASRLLEKLGPHVGGAAGRIGRVSIHARHTSIL